MKSWWPVKTFASKIDQNYNAAQYYYSQKKELFLNQANSNLINKTNSLIQSTPSIEELLNENMSKINTEFLTNWEQIYNKKFNQSTLNSLISSWQSANKIANNAILNSSQLFSLLSSLSSAAGGKAITPTTLTSSTSISMQSLLNLINSSVYSNNSSYAGARANVFGEIFEQAILLMMQEGMGNCFSSLTSIGANRVQSATTMGQPMSSWVQGKTDLLMANISLDFQNLGKGLLTATTTNQHGIISVPLDGIEWIDLESKGISSAFLAQKARKMPLAGVSAKQWTESIIGRARASSSKASMGSLALTAQLYNTRQSFTGKPISWVFKDTNTATLYSGWLVSKYLINVLGLYNIIMATGSQMIFMDQWIENIQKKGYVVSNRIKQGYVQSAKNNTTTGKAYYATNNLVLAYVDK